MNNNPDPIVFAVQSAFLELLELIEKFARQDDPETQEAFREEAQKTVLMFIAAIVVEGREYKPTERSFLSQLVDCQDKPGGEVRYLNEYATRWMESSNQIPRFFDAAIQHDSRHKTDIARSMLRLIQLIGNNAGASDGNFWAARREKVQSYLVFLERFLEGWKVQPTPQSKPTADLSSVTTASKATDMPKEANQPQLPEENPSPSMGGSIGYFQLTGWWFNSLSEADRAYIVSLYDDRVAKTLTEGTITAQRRHGMGNVWHSSGLGFYLGVNCVDFLIKMASWKMKSDKDYAFRAKVIRKIIEQVDSPTTDMVDKHVAYSWMAMHFYNERKIDKYAIQRAIWACLKQIEISPQIKPLMRTPTRLTTEDLRRLSQEAAESGGHSWETGKSLWEHCRDQNIFRSNSIVRDHDIPPYDAGYRYLVEIFQKEKQYDRLVALCEKAIEQGWDGMFWNDTLTKNRVYLGDDSPSKEWLPSLPELKWDEALLDVAPSVAATLEAKPKSDVPDCELRFVNGILQELAPEQHAVYLKLVDSIENKAYLSVEGKEEYLNYYIRKKYKAFDKGNLERLYDELLCLSVPYEEGKVGRGIFWRPKSWSYDCLLALESYDKYFESTKPANIFSTRTHFANQKCNVRYYLGMPASGVDFLQIYGGLRSRVTNFTKQHPEEFEKLLEAVFTENERNSGSLFERILADSDRKDYQNHLFPCLHFARVSKIPNYCFYGASENLTTEICGAFREAENQLRDLLGEKRVGEKWDNETKLFNTIKTMFPDLQVIHHGKPDWLGRMHLDIWIPDLKIAVEFHGAQHFEEMKHFGGAESLEATKKRDSLKRSACTRAGVRLFEVMSLDDVSQVIGGINQAANLKGYGNTAKNLELPF